MQKFLLFQGKMITRARLILRSGLL